MMRTNNTTDGASESPRRVSKRRAVYPRWGINYGSSVSWFQRLTTWPSGRFLRLGSARRNRYSVSHIIEVRKICLRWARLRRN